MEAVRWLLTGLWDKEMGRPGPEKWQWESWSRRRVTALDARKPAMLGRCQGSDSNNGEALSFGSGESLI